MPLADGDVFAGFTIARLLGSGGMGEVYLAQHPRLPRWDALKILPAALTDDADFRQRFNREADLAASMWHPNIVGLHDRGEFDGQLWITMDFVDGTDAARALQEDFPSGMPEHLVLDIVTAVADALDYAHQRNLLHRDVKPANILLTHPGPDRQRILLADFGIARRTDDIGGLTATNATVGSIAYAAPEQLMAEPLDGRADQYALAATAFHLLTGVPPFEHSNAAAVIGKHLTAPPPLVSQRRPELARLDPVLAKAMSKDPGQRFARCSDIAQALRAAVIGPAVYQYPTQPAMPWPPAQPMPARPRWPAIVVPLVLVVLLLGAAGFAATQLLRPEPRSTAAPQWQPYVDYGKQFALWLTTVSAKSAKSDVQRLLDGSTGEFHDDFARNSANFTEVLVQANTVTTGSVKSAGLQSLTGTTATVLVAASSTSSTNSPPSQEPRSWRLLLRVEKSGSDYRVSNDYKVSKVEFVP